MEGIIVKVHRKYIFICVLLTLWPSTVYGGIAPTWSHCNCRWNVWQPWSQCTSNCFGQQVREREVWITTSIPGCDEFSDCATSDMAYEYRPCNGYCHNGGTKYSSYCACVKGFTGQCCATQITCGNPGHITNGQRTGTTYTYSSTVTYSCNTHYTLTDGATTRTCQLGGTWSGTKPRCAFSNTCVSNPCSNGGTCINGIEQYTCVCNAGWSGVNCENDIQAPVLSGCNGNILRHATDEAKYVNWTSPTFHDPFGNPLKVSKNYPEDGWEFPWGDFSVQYVALKESNGLSTECRFDVSVRPTPCKDLTVPMNGALICTNWETDYGKLCRGYCYNNFTTSPAVNRDEWYVCGASGNWGPSNKMFDCKYPVLPSTTVHSTGNFPSCKDATEIQTAKAAFIKNLENSLFSYFCSLYESHCSENNVHLECN